MQTFAYQAQTADGQTMAGTIQATGDDNAQARLAALNLRVFQLEKVGTPPAGFGFARRSMAGPDLEAFNQQLAHLTEAGLPLERSLRLIARDLRSGRLARTMQEIASELESGMSLSDAFEVHRNQFPPGYGQILEVGVQTGALPQILLNLGRHLELTRRLRESVWRAAAYPAMVLIGLAFILVFISLVIVPQFEAMYASMEVPLPGLTIALFAVAAWMPFVVAAGVLVGIALPVMWRVTRHHRSIGPAIQREVLRFPLIGRVLRTSLVARWCDAVRVAINAGLDLPRALDMAGKSVGVRIMDRDSRRLIRAIENGSSLQEAERLQVIPATVPVAMDVGIRQHDLPATLTSLGQMYEEQLDYRLHTFRVALLPILLIPLAILLTLVITATFLPLIRLIQSVTG